MTALKALMSRNIFLDFWQSFWTRYYFKFVLPKIKETTLDGLRLDLSALSPKARNRIINVGYESHEKQMCSDYLSPEDSVLEIGAAIGFIGLYCQKVIGIKDYIAFEANPRTLDILKRNYRLNNLEPNAWNLALAPTDGQIELIVDSDFWENSIFEVNPKPEGKKTMNVPAATLQTLFRKVDRRVNVMIIDVEGAEQLIDFTQIPDDIDKIIIELHPHLIGAEKTREIVSCLTGKGFCLAREEANTFAFLKKEHGALPKHDVSLQKFDPTMLPKSPPTKARQ